LHGRKDLGSEDHKDEANHHHTQCNEGNGLPQTFLFGARRIFTSCDFIEGSVKVAVGSEGSLMECKVLFMRTA
jgi:hypothetical protein